MGVPGLTTFVEERGLATHHTLTASTLPLVFVVDASAFMFGIKSCNTILGGDYWKAQQTFRSIIACWRELNITPIFVFDGVSDQSKMKTTLTRNRQSIQSARKTMNELSSGKKGGAPRNSKLPPLLCSSLTEILQEMKVEIRFAEGEGDDICVELAVKHNAYILSKDSDFCIFPLQYRGYIPLDTISYGGQSQPSRKYTCPSIAFDVINFDTVAEPLKIPGHLLPFLAALSGNDQGGLDLDHLRLIGLAKVLRKLRKLPFSTDQQRRKSLVHALTILARDPDVAPEPELVDRLLQSVNTYFPVSTRSPTRITMSDPSSFILQPRPSDTEHQALCRKAHHLAFLRGKIVPVLLRLFKYSLSVPAYSYERMDAVSISIECRPIRMWIYGFIHEGVGFEPVVETDHSRASEGEVTEIVRDGESTVQTVVEIASIPTLVKLYSVSVAFDPSIPTVLKPIEKRTVFIQRIFRVPAIFDFRLDKVYFPLVCALLHIDRFADDPFSQTDVLAALITAALRQLPSSPRSLFGATRSSRTVDNVHKSTQLIVTLHHLDILWQVLDLSWEYSFPRLFEGEVFHFLLDMTMGGLMRFLEMCPKSVKAVVDRLRRVVQA